MLWKTLSVQRGTAVIKILRSTLQMCLLIFFAFSSKTTFAQLVIGVPAFHPPYSMSVDKNLSTGFDIDIMRNLCKIMARSCRFKTMNFSQLFPSLIKKEIDLAIGGITITEKRLQSYIFSYPYLVSYARFVSLDKDKNKPIAGTRVGVIQGSIFPYHIHKLFGHTTKVIPFENTFFLINALREQKVEFIMVDEPSAKYWEQHDDHIFEITGPRVRIGFGIGIMAMPQKGKLMQEINKAIVKLEASGKYIKIYNRYLGSIGSQFN